MALVVKRCERVADTSPFGGSVPKCVNYGWAVYVDPVDAPSHMAKQLLLGPTFAREVDANIAKAVLSKLKVDWDETNPRKLCYNIFAVTGNERSLDRIMTEHLQW